MKIVKYLLIGGATGYAAYNLLMLGMLTGMYVATRVECIDPGLEELFRRVDKNLVAVHTLLN